MRLADLRLQRLQARRQRRARLRRQRQRQDVEIELDESAQRGVRARRCVSPDPRAAGAPRPRAVRRIKRVGERPRRAWRRRERLRRASTRSCDARPLAVEQCRGSGRSSRGWRSLRPSVRTESACWRRAHWRARRRRRRPDASVISAVSPVGRRLQEDVVDCAAGSSMTHGRMVKTCGACASSVSSSRVQVTVDRRLAARQAGQRYAALRQCRARTLTALDITPAVERRGRVEPLAIGGGGLPGRVAAERDGRAPPRRWSTKPGGRGLDIGEDSTMRRRHRPGRYRCSSGSIGMSANS